MLLLFSALFLSLSLLLQPVWCLFPLEVHCKYTALHPIRYLTVKWPQIAPSVYKRLEVRISRVDGEGDDQRLVMVEREWYEEEGSGGGGGTEAVVPVVVEGGVEVAVWGELKGGWVLLSIVTAVNACRQYRL